MQLGGPYGGVNPICVHYFYVLHVFYCVLLYNCCISRLCHAHMCAGTVQLSEPTSILCSSWASTSTQVLDCTCDQDQFFCMLGSHSGAAQRAGWCLLSQWHQQHHWDIRCAPAVSEIVCSEIVRASLPVDCRAWWPPGFVSLGLRLCCLLSETECANLLVDRRAW